MTTQEAAQELGVQRVSVLKAIYRGSLLASKLGRDYYIDEWEVARYKSERQGIPDQEPTGSDECELALPEIVLPSLSPRNKRRPGENHKDYLARVAPSWLANVREREGDIMTTVTANGNKIWWRSGHPEIVSSHSAEMLIRRERQYILSVFSAALDKENQKRHSDSIVKSVHEFAQIVGADVLSVNYSSSSESVYITLGQKSTKLIVRYSGHLADPNVAGHDKELAGDGTAYQIRSPANVDRPGAMWVVDFYEHEMSVQVLAAAWKAAKLKVRGDLNGRVFVDDLQLRKAVGIPA